jgi:hypothetical protein
LFFLGAHAHVDCLCLDSRYSIINIIDIKIEHSSCQSRVSKTTPACRALGLCRSSFYRPSLVSGESRRVRKEVLELSERHPRYDSEHHGAPSAGWI